MFPLIRVAADTDIAIEPLGTKSKFWYRDGGRRVLFKAEERGTGEDWAEKIACELCTLLGLPHVHYELAVTVSDDRPGVVCTSCLLPGQALILGNQLMVALDSSYPAENPRYRVASHTVAAVCQVLGGLEAPAQPWMDDCPAGIASALDVFTGYVMLDAWVANQDRHHENWGAIRDGESVSLAPTFDHGAGLARNLSDAERYERMNTRDTGRKIAHFARRATSAFYGNAEARRPLSTLDAWLRFSERRPEAASIWKKRLAGVESRDVERVLADVPPDRMSAICRAFTLRLLNENRTRLLSGNP